MRKHMVRRTIIVLIVLAMTLGSGTSAFAGQEGNLIRFIPVNVDVVKEACGQHLLVTVPAGLPEGIYAIEAIWTKNG